jgi:hypothetical protein
MFAMHAVHRLVHAFVFNDQIGADRPDFKQHLFDFVNERVSGGRMYSFDFIRRMIRSGSTRRCGAGQRWRCWGAKQ